MNDDVMMMDNGIVLQMSRSKNPNRNAFEWNIFRIFIILFQIHHVSSWIWHSSLSSCHQNVMLYQSMSPYENNEEFEKPDEHYTDSFRLRNNHWIVLIDDEESIRVAVACADAEAFLHVLSSSEKEPDVIVSDIRMPNSSIDGLKLLSLLKGNDPEMYDFSKWKNIPVILLTAKSLTPDRIAGYKLGAQAYLSKPFSPDELLSIIDNLIRRRTEQSNSMLDTKNLDILKDDLNDIKSLLRTNSQDRKILDLDYGKDSRPFQSSANQPLTPTEIEVLSLLCEGYSNSEIALRRGKSSIGIGKVISKLYLKTQTKTRTELVRWALQTGLVT